MARIHRSRLLALGTACAAVLAVSTAPTVGAAANKHGTEKHNGPLSSTAGRDSFGFYDSRQNGGRTTQALLQSRMTARTADQSKALKRLGNHLGQQAVISVDPITRTPRTVARLDGFLSKKSSQAPKRHRDALHQGAPCLPSAWSRVP